MTSTLASCLAISVIFSLGFIAAAFIGASLTSGEAAALYAALNDNKWW